MPVEIEVRVVREATDQEDLQFLLRNWNLLVDRYNGKFVAVCEGKIVAVGESWEEAYSTAKSAGHNALVVQIRPDKWKRWYG